VKKWIKRLFTANNSSTKSKIGPTRFTGPPADNSHLATELTQSIALFLTLAQRYVINCPSLNPAYFKSEIHKIIGEYHDSLTASSEARLRERSNKLITGQWDRESEYLEDKEKELRLIIEMITSEIKSDDAECRTFSDQMSESLAELQEVVEVEDIRQIRQRMTKVLDQVSSHLARRTAQDEKRISSLTEQVSILQSRLELTGTEDRIDPLTSLHNRSAFDDRLNAEVGLSRRLNKPLSLVIVDIDQFALTNQTYGDLIGDEVLVELSNQLFKEFFHKTDYITRFDGDAFAVILCQTPVETAIKGTENLCRVLGKTTLATSIGDVTITISAGVAELTESESAEEFKERVSGMQLEALSDGGNRVVTVKQEMDEEEVA